MLTIYASCRGFRRVGDYGEVVYELGLTNAERKEETMHMPIPCAQATQIVFTATGQQYHQTTCFSYLDALSLKYRNGRARLTGRSAWDG